MSRHSIMPAKRPFAARGVKWLPWLAYLALFFMPWLDRKPTQTEAVISVVAIAVFLALYFDAYFRRPDTAFPHAIAMAAIGFGLSTVSPFWCVFNIFAAALAGRLQPRRAAVVLLIGLQISIVVFGVGLHFAPMKWGAGLVIGALAGAGGYWQAGLERKNIELKRSQEEVRSLATAAERERIARDLHDLLGHTLTLIALKADLAERLITVDGAASRKEIIDIAGISREALMEVRGALSGMHGATLTVEIERAKRMLGAANVNCSVLVAPVAAGSGEAVLAMALREAVTNVIRHSSASHCTIALSPCPTGDLRLSISDDGQGGAISEGGGLSGMRNRLAAAGGALEILSGADGTRIDASIPCDKA